MTLFEVDEAANRVREEVDPEANIIVGSTLDESMDGQMRVSVVATGIDVGDQPPYGQPQATSEPQPTAAPTFRLRPQGQQPQGGQDMSRPQAAPSTPEVKPMTPSLPDGGFSPDQPAGMTLQTGTPGLRPKTDQGGDVLASVRRPKPSFNRPQPPMAQSGSEWGQTRMPERDLSRAPSLFERVTQSFSRQRQEHVEPTPEPAMAGADAPERPASSKEEELYDIPTFLRR
jgi:cell division protein FtsZ